MNDPQQIRRAMTEIRRALESYPREGLAEVLALVFKEYVVEGQQALASGGNVLDARSDLEGLSFAELMVWLQTHLDLPELALFEVMGSEVAVRADGRSVKIQARPAQAAAPAPASAPSVTAPLRAAPLPQAPARPPASTAVPVQAALSAAPSGPAASGPTATAVAAPAKDDAASETGTRFSLLEVD